MKVWKPYRANGTGKVSTSKVLRGELMRRQQVQHSRSVLTPYAILRNHGPMWDPDYPDPIVDSLLELFERPSLLLPS